MMDRSIYSVLMYRTSTTAERAGFTLVEILVVIGIVAILMAITLVALNPGEQFKKTKDARRMSDANTILNATYAYIIDNRGSIPAIIPTGTPRAIQTSEVDLCPLLVPQYVATLPRDPDYLNGQVVTQIQCGGGYNTRYMMNQENGKIYVWSLTATPSIRVGR